MLTGCFENSGYLVKTCTKEEKSDTFTGITTYTFGFKSDVIDDLKLLMTIKIVIVKQLKL